MNIYSIKKIIVISALSALVLTGCEKQVCDYCGEEKYCEEYDILGTTRYICDDCLNTPSAGVSGNVIAQYAAEALPTQEPSESSNDTADTESASDTTDSSSSSESVQTSDASQTSATATSSSDTGTSNIPESTTNSNTSATSNDETTTNAPAAAAPASSTNIYLTRDEALNTISASIADSGLTIVADDNASATYKIMSGGNSTGISIKFSNGNNGTLAASVTKSASSSDTDYATCCINTALAFLGSTDVSGTGYTLYNTALEHGNYTKDSCRFYYMEDGNSASFDISFK